MSAHWPCRRCGRSIRDGRFCIGCTAPVPLFLEATPQLIHASDAHPPDSLWRPRLSHMGLTGKVCSECGGEFSATRQDAKHCSARCRKRASRAAKAAA